MPAITHVLETSVYAADLAVTAAFYERVLRFRRLLATPRLVAFDCGGKSVLLVFQHGATSEDITDGRGTIPGHDAAGKLHLAFAIPAGSLEEWRDHLVAEGVAITGEYAWPRGGHSLYFSDPDDAVVELATPGLWATY